MSIKDFKIDFDAQKGLALGEYKICDAVQSKAYGMCGTGYRCAGGGGLRCAGG